jgi:hypothetical protein
MLASLNEEGLKRARVNNERLVAMGRMIGQAQNALSSLLELATLDMTSWEDINEGKKSQK